MQCPMRQLNRFDGGNSHTCSPGGTYGPLLSSSRLTGRAERSQIWLFMGSFRAIKKQSWENKYVIVWLSREELCEPARGREEKAVITPDYPG